MRLGLPGRIHFSPKLTIVILANPERRYPCLELFQIRK